MTSREPTNVAASVRQRLLNLARERNEPFDQVLQYYAIERFLYRVGKSRWSDCLIVKGAAMLRVLGAPMSRPTRDIDFFATIRNDPGVIEDAVADCLAVEVEDGIRFSSEVRTQAITVEDRYPGVRAVLTGELAGAKFTLKLDVGVDDAVVPGPEWVKYPTLLGMDQPEVLAYQPTTAVAEKFEAMVDLGAANSRMKDFYDLWMLSRTQRFEGDLLVASLRATFTHRGTALPTEPPIALTPDFHGSERAHAMWATFLRRSALDAPDLADVMPEIQAFLMPAAEAAAGSGGLERTWLPGTGWASIPSG